MNTLAVPCVAYLPLGGKGLPSPISPPLGRQTGSSSQSKDRRGTRKAETSPAAPLSSRLGKAVRRGSWLCSQLGAGHLPARPDLHAAHHCLAWLRPSEGCRRACILARPLTSCARTFGHDARQVPYAKVQFYRE